MLMTLKITLPETKTSHLPTEAPKGNKSSNHPFSGAIFFGFRECNGWKPKMEVLGGSSHDL